MKNVGFQTMLCVLVINSTLWGQVTTQINPNQINFLVYSDSLKNPEKVTQLKVGLNDIVSFSKNFSKFSNLAYLSLRDDHLLTIPEEVFEIPTLVSLDLGGNDFKVIEARLARLVNLEELYLDNEPNLDLEKSIKGLAELPKLKSLHLENDKIKSLPKNLSELKSLEYLYLNNNLLRLVPQEINTLEHLKLLDLKNNPVRPENQKKDANPAVKIEF
ncbi:MAG: leucine-rich repeat domain-containing protein [Leadbetterella sp.]